MNPTPRLPRRHSPPSAAPGYGAAPPASRVATAIATRRTYGPPLTPEPLRPLTAQRHGQAHRPCPPDRAALNGSYQDQTPTNMSLRFEGIANQAVWLLVRAAS
jgi:hypothetical protein